LITAISLTLGALCAQAGVDVKTSVSNFQFQLIDLDPNDSITPSFTRIAGGAGGHFDIRSADGLYQSATVFFPDFRSLERSLSAPPMTADFRFAGDKLGTFAMIGQAHTSLDSVIGVPVSEVLALTNWWEDYWLSPKTQLKLFVSGSVDVKAAVTTGASSSNLIRGDVSVWLRAPDITKQDGVSFESKSGLADFHEDRTIELTYSNYADGQRLVSAWIETLAANFVSPIPELNSMWMHAAGLAVLGWLGRRRTRHA
jgi:hypothetical protein